VAQVVARSAFAAVAFLSIRGTAAAAGPACTGALPVAGAFAAGVLLAGLLALLAFEMWRHRFRRPLKRLARAMECLRDGDIAIMVPGVNRRDEIGTMARAVQVFRANTIRMGQNELELKRINARFDVAISNIAQGLCMFDDDERLIVVNHRFLDLYNLPADEIVPGMTTREFIAARVRAGNYPPDWDLDAIYGDAHERIQRRHAETYLATLADGRTIAILFQPIAEGGYVATHQDITLLRQREEELRIQNIWFEAALNNMPHGLCMFDNERRLIVCNRRYSELYSLPEELTRRGVLLDDIHAYVAELGGDELGVLSRHWTVAGSPPSTDQTIVRMTDGRLLAVSSRPKADGGWVSIHEDITERRRADERIAHLARHDALTDLPNRVLFHESMDRALARMREGEMFAVLCLDLDRFKFINDTLGHPAGDALLQAAAARLMDCLREADLVARLGGDEFAILQMGLERPDAAAALASRIVEAIGEPFEIDGNHVLTSVSIGVALAPHDAAGADELLKRADLALYRAKADGRDRFRFFEAAMDRNAQERRLLELDLRQALPRGEFELHFQSCISVATGRINGFEALLRWRHPTRGMVPPSEFIPLAEEIGLIVPIGEWVLQQACTEAANWPDEIRVAVNLSAVQFISGRLVDTVAGALARSGLAPRRLELEITESVLLQDDAAACVILNELRTLGTHISLDDFGTGYSSLSYLRRFPFERIKIDRSFVQHLCDNDDCVAIVRAVTGLGRSLGIVTTAEGVETQEQFERLRADHCTEVQGFLFGQPLPAAEVSALLETRREQAAA